MLQRQINFAVLVPSRCNDPGNRFVTHFVSDRALGEEPFGDHVPAVYVIDRLGTLNQLGLIAVDED